MGDGVSIQTKKALIESGAYTPEDLGLAVMKPAVQPAWAVGGSSAAADQRQVTGETPLQQRQRQDAQLKALLEARKRKGYAKGGVIELTYNVQNPMEHAQSYTQDKSIEQMQDDSLNAIKRGLRTWPGELPAFLAGDIPDGLYYAARKIGNGQSEKSIPSLGAGAAIRRALNPQPASMPAVSDPELPALQELTQFVNPLLWMSPAPLLKPIKALKAPRGVQRMLAGHSLDAILAPVNKLRQIMDEDDFYKQVADLSKTQDLRGRQLLDKGASIPDLTTDFFYNWENGGKNYEVLPGPNNKRGWASISPKEEGKPAYISGIMAEEPGSKDFVNGTFNALLNETKGPTRATAANGALSRYYKSKGIPVDDDWNMNFASGGMVRGGLARLAKFLGSDAAPVRRGVADVIKERGGQWLSGSVEGALGGLRKYADPYDIELMRKNLAEPHPDLTQADELEKALTSTKDSTVPNIIKRDIERLRDRGNQQRDYWKADLEQLLRSQSLNNFVDKQLTNYVKNQMATPEDPVRALAERGVLHVDPETIPIRNLVHPSGEETRKLGVSEAAKRWENRSDRAVAFNPASDYQDFGHSNMTREHPWVAKLDPNTPIHHYNTVISTQDLGFDHLIDELSNAINPESGLPRHLQLDPKSLERVSVPQAVERVHNINLWRAAMKAEADAAKANNAATVLHKEYPEKGMKWVELKQGDLPEGWEQDGLDIFGPGGVQLPANGSHDPRYKALQEALKYEGDTMGHCVGDYCEDVASGRSRIYSLRDAKGQPHVTIETSQPGVLVPITDEMRAERGYLRPQDRFMDFDTGLGYANDRVYPSIVQIKGKGNKKPIADYIPFVQDFIKSGQWSEVGEIANADLIPRSKLLLSGDEEAKVLGDYFTKEEYDAIKKSQGYASGGLIDLYSLHGYN